uniref:Lamina-associated polypeptide 2 alpha C-terminal domain-containing protein n=1 Tax=Xenopus tropicalis TaxID=8364 RepID=A0A803K0H8_XENTR
MASDPQSLQGQAGEPAHLASPAPSINKRPRTRQLVQKAKKGKTETEQVKESVVAQIPEWFQPFQASLLTMSASIEKLATLQVHQALSTSKSPHLTNIQTEEEVEPSSEEEGVLQEDSSDWEDSDAPPQTSGLAQKPQAEAVQGLLSDMFLTLDIQEEHKETKTLDKLFGSPLKKQKNFPVHETVQEIIKKEWKTPDRKLIKDKRMETLYPFEHSHKDQWESVPKVDAPVARLAKRTTIPLEDGTSFKDPMDRKAENLLKNIFSTAITTFKPTIASACVARTTVLWLEEALAGLPQGEPTSDLLSKALNAVHFLCDASMDMIQLAAKASALAVGARRALWLKTWSADQASKKNLLALPFSGTSLFGPELDPLIISYHRTRNPELQIHK